MKRRSFLKWLSAMPAAPIAAKAAEYIPEQETRTIDIELGGDIIHIGPEEFNRILHDNKITNDIRSFSIRQEVEILESLGHYFVGKHLIKQVLEIEFWGDPGYQPGTEVEIHLPHKMLAYMDHIEQIEIFKGIVTERQVYCAPGEFITSEFIITSQV